jgi:hypothetical protein
MRVVGLNRLRLDEYPAEALRQPHPPARPPSSSPLSAACNSTSASTRRPCGCR